MTDYSGVLSKETRNLTQAAKNKELTLPLFRDSLIEKLVGIIKSGRSILLTGDGGVGKTAVVHGLARKLAPEYRQLNELTSMTILTGTRYLGEWQTKAQQLLDEAEKKRAVLYFADIWNLPTVGSSSNDPSALLDFLRAGMSSGRYQVVGEVSAEVLESMHRTPGFVSLFDLVEVPELSAEDIEAIVEKTAATIQLELDVPSRKHLINLCNSFKAKEPGPGPALELLGQVKSYSNQKRNIDEIEAVDSGFINKVFSIYSGLPLFIISSAVTKPRREIRQWFRERVIGQEEAIDAVTEAITLFKAGIRDPRQPIGTFLFVGPTGVGKTELAKTLATFLFGSETRLLRFDMSEYKDYHSFEMLLGDPGRPKREARLVDPVRAQPFQVILFDEIEKAHPNVSDLLLQLLDEGTITPASGKPVNFRNTIIICTTNVGAQDVAKDGIGFTAESERKVSLQSLEHFFRPEILNRFQHIVSFRSLTKDNVKTIANIEIKRILSREGLVGRNLAVDIDDEVMQLIVEAGFSSSFGARALKRAIQRIVALSIASFLMENNVTDGSLLTLRVSNGRPVIKAIATDLSKESELKQAEYQQQAQQQLTVRELQAALTEVDQCIDGIKQGISINRLEQRLYSLDEFKQGENFWNNTQDAMAAIAEIDNINATLQRVDELDSRRTSIAEKLSGDIYERDLANVQKALQRLQQKAQQARRELLSLATHEDAAVLVISPIGNSKLGRDELFSMYVAWAKARNRSYRVLSESLSDDDSVILLIEGAYAFGYLQAEAGLHRFRQDEVSCTARVAVAPFCGEMTDVLLGQQKALKLTSQYGNKLRSLVEVVSEPVFVIRNDKTIVENRELARQLGDALARQVSSDNVVRRYDLQPLYIKDYLTEESGSLKGVLNGRSLQELLERRVDLIANS